MQIIPSHALLSCDLMGVGIDDGVSNFGHCSVSGHMLHCSALSDDGGER